MKTITQTKSPKLIIPLVPLSVLAGCATTLPSGPSVMALPGSGKSFDQFRYDDTDCRNFAFAQIGGPAAAQASTESSINSVFVGTLLGTAVGAAIGGNDGAAAGAGIGLAMGSASGAQQAQYSSYEAQKRYDHAYVQCMYAKGQRVPVPGNLSQRSGAPMPQYSNNGTPSAYVQSTPVQATTSIPPPPPGAGMPPDYAAQNSAANPAPVMCLDCGVIESIREIPPAPKEASPAGVIVGGLVGAALGNQVGQGSGKAVATAAGAVAGGVIGNSIAESNTPNNVGSFLIVVRMGDGRTETVKQLTPPQWPVGAGVRVVNGQLKPR